MPFRDPEARRAYFARRNQEPARKAQKRLKRPKTEKAKAYARKYESIRRQRQAETRDFVAVDSEGYSFGEGYTDHLGRIVRPHRTFLWGAGDANGHDDWLEKAGPLSSREICDWLTSLPAKFPRAFFVAFSFSYDAAQIVADLPYEKIWEIQRGEVWGKPELGKVRRTVYWKNYGFRYLKGKKFSIVKYAHQKRQDAKPKVLSRIMIYDVFGYFQSSFLKACKSMPGAVGAEEFALLDEGKANRRVFDPSQIDKIKPYTATELKVLARMMTILRAGMWKEDIKVTQWHGAGTIAQALLKREKVDEHYLGVKAEQIDEPQRWAHYSYFGGRIELVKQGRTSKPLYGYDISSAYPAIAATLPSMAGGSWRFVERPSRAQLERMSAISLVELRLSGPAPRRVPFFALPYRTPTGSILFPQDVHGRYCVTETLAALRWADRYATEVELVAAWEFVPANDLRPFAFLEKLYAYRAALPKSSIEQIVVKLGINSVYGKMAQAIGDSTYNRGKPPRFANPFYAAAITAGTRARLLDAAMLDPGAIVMLATDGIISTRPLPLDVPSQKALGAWEAAKISRGGSFIQSGVYAIWDDAKGAYAAKSRGFRPSHLEGLDVAAFLTADAPALWAKGIDAFSFRYSTYVTIGAASTSADNAKTIGCWAEGQRELRLDSAGSKRALSRGAKGLADRSRRLVATTANCRNFLLIDEDTGAMPISAPFVPEWLDEDLGLKIGDEVDQATIDAARFEDDF